MRRKLIFSVFVVSLLGLLNSVLAFPLKVDIGRIGQTVKSGWEEFSGDGNNEIDPKTEIYQVGELSISVSLQTGVLNDSGYRDYGGGDLGGDMVYPDNCNGPVNGRVILTLGNLPAGSYTLTSYHNDTKDTHAQQDPIDVTVGGAITASSSDLDVVQTKSLDDDNLGSSTVSFAADGTGDVNVVYTPTTSNGVVSKAVLNGFELDLVGGVVSMLEFDSAAAADFESVSPVILSVVLSPATPNTVTVDYNVTGGTATPVEDYTFSAGTLTFDPNQTTPEYVGISVINDGEPEDDETIEVTLSNPVNAMLGTNSQHTYTILDPSPRVGFATTAGEGREDVSPAYIPVNLSWAWSETVTVDYNVTGGTAISGEDYSLPYGTLIFEPGDVTEYISITIVEDDYDEDPDETIEITLSNPGNAKLGINSQHTFTILPTAVQVCPKGDLDGDCDVDTNDLRSFGQQWLDPPGSCSGFDCADMDGINGVDMYDFAFLAENWFEKAWPLVINECMASNDYTIADPQGEYNDWIEIYNGGGVAIDIGGMWLADTGNWWQIPDDRPAETTIAAGGYLLIWADDDVNDTPGLHASFKLSKDGDEINLYATDGSTLIDRLEFRTQVSDISYGRYPDAGDNLRFFATPTPGEENVGAYLGEVADTKFSHDRGFYESAFNLSITCNTSDANIHYTLNGSEPNEFAGDGTYPYTGPINISGTTAVRAAAFKPGYLPTNVDTQTYIFLDDVISQPDMDPGVVATYSSVIEDAFKSVPTLSIAIDANDLANLQQQDSQYPSTGLPKKELATSVELIYADPNDGEGFQINCAIEGHSWALSKRSYKLIFKSVFGPTQLRYPLYESAPVNTDSAVDEFDRIVLRASKNMPVTYAGDQWTRDSEIAMSGISAHGTYVHLYLNGAYWGLYNATERPDAWFTSSYFGGQKEDYFATNHGIERGEDHISGDSSRFDTMISMAQARNLEDPCNYETFKGLCDATKFADYTILFWFSGFGDNIDNNWYGGMRNVPLVGSVPPEGFMMFMWDAEYVFLNEGGPPGNSVPWVPSYYFSMTGHTIVDVWNGLRENADFMMVFADRIYKHCLNSGALTDDNAQARWDAIVDHIANAAICELARWPGGGGYSGPATVPPETVDMNGFVDIFMTALDSWGGLYPTIDPPIFNQHGGQVAPGFGLEMTNPNLSGDIYYTLDGSDPREAVTGNPVGATYGGAISLNESKHVKARVFDDPTWSALNEAVFAVGPVVENLRITEIMYHPQDANDPNAEFIELKNIGAQTINLNLVSFTDGIDFTFDDSPFGPSLYSASFESSSEGFAYADDTFNGTSNPGFAEGSYEASGGYDDGGLRVFLGGPGHTGGATSGGWWKNVTVDSNVTVSLHYRMIMSGDYTGDEYSEAVLEIDGVRYGWGSDNSLVRYFGNDVIFLADFEDANGSYDNENFSYDDNPNWPGTNLWHATQHRASSSAWSQYYGIEGAWDYDTGAGNGGYLVSPAISLYGVTGSVNLSFDYFLDTEASSPPWDVVTVEISDDGGSSWDSVAGNYGGGLTDPTAVWTGWTGDISAYTGADIVVRFGFDTGDDTSNHFEGWYIDNVTVISGETCGGVDTGWLTASFDALLSGGSHLITLGAYSSADAGDAYTEVYFDDLTISSRTPPTLNPGESLVLVKDFEGFESCYGQGIKVAGQYTGSLNNGGETIKLEDAIGQTIHEFEYRDGWRSITDGGGFSLTIIDPNNSDPNSWSQKDSWRPSVYVGGSPGWDDTGILPNPGAVVINEVMAHSHLLPDWIELYNTTAGAIDIGGWFLSDSDRDEPNLTKYRIADGTTIDLFSYLVFYEDVNFADQNDPGCNEPFALSENGEKVVLSSYQDANGHLTGYRQLEDFGASESNVSFGRYYKSSTDNYNFVAMDYNTPRASNAYPTVGPIVINEIMYHPDWPDLSLYNNENYEYIELYNISGADVNLFDEEDIRWKFTDGIDYTFPVDANIPAGGYALVVKDPDAFDWRYGSPPAGVQIFGPYDGKLSNSGEKLELSMPGDVDEFGTRYYIRVDRVNYSDGSHPENSPDGVDHWPSSADGVGASLNRLSTLSYGNDPNNWDANTPSPGEAAP